MKYTSLGRSGLKVSRLCLGTMNFGPHATPEESHTIMDRALEHGINFFDTADVYGWQKGEGVTEKIIGDWFAKGDNRREKTVLATKFYGNMGKGNMEGWPNTSDVTALHIRRACEASLQRLKTDYIDLYQMHHIYRDTPWEEVWEAFSILKQQGKIVYVGSSNFAGWHIAQANEKAKRRGVMGLVSEQSKYSLLQREIEMEVGPAAEAYGVGIIPWSPLAGGILGGVIKTSDGQRRHNEHAKATIEKHRDALTRWEDLCESIGEKPADVALAWTLSKSFVTGPIIGPRTIEQLDGSLRALEIEWNSDLDDKINAIFPGFKTSPEHYAW